MVVEATARCVSAVSRYRDVLYVAEVVLVGSRIVPHFDVGVPLSHQPRGENVRHFADRAGPEGIQPHAIELMLAWRAPDTDFHTCVGSKHSTEIRRGAQQSTSRLCTQVMHCRRGDGPVLMVERTSRRLQRRAGRALS